MFHVVFNANESYIKYLAVLCYSIIAHTNLGKKEDQEGYHFHILTDGLTSKTQAKIEQFQTQLAEIYPCKIDVYCLNDEDFQGLPKLNGNYLTYFRLKIAKVLPQEIQKCLYLDVDMLCLSDIREIFSIDLGGKICGAVKDAHYQSLRIMECKDRSRGEGIALGLESYFNAGLMLIDLQEWKKQRIEERCFELLQNYIPDLHDQGTLNAVLENKVLLLPLEWNFMTGHFETTWVYFEGNHDDTLVYTREEYLLAKERVKIVHFLTPRKPWKGGDFQESFYRSKWWEFAFLTPVFSDEFYLVYFMAFEETLIGLGQVIEEQRLLRQIVTIMRRIKRKSRKIFNFLRRNNSHKDSGYEEGGQ